MEAHGVPAPASQPPSSATAYGERLVQLHYPSVHHDKRRSPWFDANLAVKGGESAREGSSRKELRPFFLPYSRRVRGEAV